MLELMLDGLLVDMLVYLSEFESVSKWVWMLVKLWVF